MKKQRILVINGAKPKELEREVNTQLEVGWTIKSTDLELSPVYNIYSGIIVIEKIECA